MSSEAAVVARALALLGKRNVVVAIHDPSFPSAPGEDIGRGTPYSRGGQAWLKFVADLGFNGVQFGPQGLTSASNPSPYDGAIFARNILSLDLFALARDPAWHGLVGPGLVAKIVAAAPKTGARRVPHAAVYAAQSAALAEIHARFVAAAADPLRAEFAAFQAEHSHWLADAATFAGLAEVHGTDDWRCWPALDRDLPCASSAQAAVAARRATLADELGPALARHSLAQFMVHAQHAALRAAVRPLGLKLYGDLQIGIANQDVWVHREKFLKHYLLGAPPSRTNPAGQPWGYPVLDPRQYTTADGRPGPALQLVAARVDKLLAEFDGLRLDHPHGLVCPWVYRADAADVLAAVQSGARLFSAPDLPDHPELAAYAIARPEQLDRTQPRHADGWVRSLDDAQVLAYSPVFAAIVAAATSHGRVVEDLLCEVLSTQPYPLRRVQQRYGLGRFRVTQKANLNDPNDGYRSEHAEPADWIMVGNHDTPSIWALVQRWQESGHAVAQARDLAERLTPDGEDVAAMAAQWAADPHRLAHAKYAEIFASRAENVQIFFADLFGYTESYNVPGTVHDDNWSLRVAHDYATRYPEDRRKLAALNLPWVLATALCRRGQPPSAERDAVVAALRQIAERDG